MLRKNLLMPLFVAVASTMIAPANAATGELTGDPRLACQALMCLPAATRPQECNDAIRRYFSISHKRLKDTIKARKNFLSLCPKK